jgi:hypothetical protein
MVRTLATERANLAEARAEIERLRLVVQNSAANLVGAPNGWMTTSCSSVLKTSTPTLTSTSRRGQFRKNLKFDWPII